MSLSTGFSPKPFGMILSRRLSSTKRRSRRFRRPRRAAMRHRKPQVGDAGLEVVLEAGDALGSSVP